MLSTPWESEGPKLKCLCAVQTTITDNVFNDILFRLFLIKQQFQVVETPPGVAASSGELEEHTMTDYYECKSLCNVIFGSKGGIILSRHEKDSSPRPNYNKFWHMLVLRSYTQASMIWRDII